MTCLKHVLFEFTRRDDKHVDNIEFCHTRTKKTGKHAIVFCKLSYKQISYLEHLVKNVSIARAKPLLLNSKHLYVRTKCV